MTWPTTAATAYRGRYDCLTTRISAALVEQPGKTARWYAERTGTTRNICQKLLSRLRQRQLCESRIAADLLFNTRRWYPTAMLCERVRSGKLVDTHQMRIMELLADRPWLTSREISAGLAVSINTIAVGLRVLLLRGELQRDLRRSPMRWALADEVLPAVVAEAS